MINCENQSEIEDEILDRLGFCGCGMPDDAIRLINDLMKYIWDFFIVT